RRLADRLAPLAARRSRSGQRGVAGTNATCFRPAGGPVMHYPRPMPRSWAQLLGEADAAPEPPEQRGGRFARRRDSLSKSRRALTGELAAATFDPGNAPDWERLEEALIMGDVGVRATAELVQRLEARGDLSRLEHAPRRRGRAH